MNGKPLDQISAYIQIYYDGWTNGKIGAICDVEGKGIYRFYETVRGNNGNLMLRHENKKDNPVVCVGIVAYWILRRKSASNLMNKLLRLGAHIDTSETVRQMYENYTQMRYSQFRNKFRDDAQKWDWEESDWKKNFYCDYVISNEINFNRQSQSLFDFISDDETIKVKAVMDNYIKYLYTCLVRYQQESTAKTENASDYTKQHIKDEDNHSDNSADKDVEIIEKLTPLFYNEEQDAQKFLQRVKGTDNKNITIVVLEFLDERKLSPSSKGRKLYKILKNAGIYNAGETNWNTALRNNREKINKGKQ